MNFGVAPPTLTTDLSGTPYTPRFMAGGSASGTQTTTAAGTPWQEFIKALPTLTNSFSQIYSVIAYGDRIYGIEAPSQQPTPQLQQRAAGFDPTLLLYGGLGLAGIVTLVVLLR